MQEDKERRKRSSLDS